MRYIFSALFVLFFIQLQAQSVQFAGQYSAMVNGEKITLSIEQKNETSYTGSLYDGYSTMSLRLQLSGNRFEGVATDAAQSVNIDVDGEISGDRLVFYFVVDPYGEEEDEKIIFTRDLIETKAIATESNPSAGVIVFPPGATHPNDLLGTWTKEELYQSGYGDAYMGAGTSQSMTFLSEGRMADAGSSSYISGSNYSGQSSGQGGGVIPGISWYAIDNQLYLQVTENGQAQNIHLGKYYIEGNNMLITGTNGEKLLLAKK